jgi:hypothetical protein
VGGIDITSSMDGTQILAAPLKRLFTDHGAPIALHRSVVGREQLGSDHALELVLWPNTGKRVHRCVVLTVARFVI